MNNGIVKSLAVIFIILIIGVIAIYAVYSQSFKQKTQTSSNVIINFWGINYPANVMQPVIDQYEKLHPNVTIEYTKQPSNNYKAITVTRINSPSSATPDIIAINNNWLPLIQSGLSPIPSNVYTLSEYKNTFYPTALNDFLGTDGKVYAVPSEYDGLGLFYNKQLLASKGYTAPSTDLNQFIIQSQNLTITDDRGNILQAGFAGGTTNNIFNSADILLLFMLQNGVSITDPTGTISTISTPSGTEALQYYLDILKKYGMWNSTMPNSIDAFTQGKLAFMYAPIWVVQNIKQGNPSLQFDIAPIPQLENTVNLSNYWAYAVPASSPVASQAWDFIKYMSSQQSLETIYQGTLQAYGFGYPYPRIDMANLLKDSQFSASYVKMAPTAVSVKLGDFDSAETELNNAIDNAQNGDLNTALQQAALNITKELQQNNTQKK